MLGDTTKPMRSVLEAKRGGAAGEAHIDAQTARERRKEREPRSDELWTLAVTQALVSELPRVLTPPPQGESGEEAVTAASDSVPPVMGARWEAAGAGDAARATDAAGAPEAAGSSSESDGLPAELCTEVSDERFGKLRLVVARGARGLDIVINVADSHVKALIEAEQAILMKTLKDAGLTVASVQIGSVPRPGTQFAHDREGPERSRQNASSRQPAARWRTYQGSIEEEDVEGDGVDLTA
jgi:hypothetical protein